MSHQWLVVIVGVVVGLVVGVVVSVVVGFVVFVVVWVGVVVGVDLAQDAKTRDTTIRQEKINQTILLFICSPSLVFMLMS